LIILLIYPLQVQMSSSSGHLPPLSHPAAKKQRHEYGQHSKDPTKPMIQRMLDGELYLASDPECDKQMEMCKKWMSRLNSTGIGLPPQERRALVAERVNIGPGTQVHPPFFCDYGECYGSSQVL
jgi:hypothetical protein